MSTFDSLSFRVSEEDRENIEIGVFTLGGECADVITIPRHEARNYVKALQVAIRESVGQWWACPDCGCTDVQGQAWIMENTEEVQDSCESYGWCNQCGHDGDGELSGLDLVRKPVPFDPDRKAEEEFLIHVKAVMPDVLLHDYDKEVSGHYIYKANTEDEALDMFHSTIPIKVLDDFVIEAIDIWETRT